jgi:hypothetical protein
MRCSVYPFIEFAVGKATIRIDDGEPTRSPRSAADQKVAEIDARNKISRQTFLRHVRAPQRDFEPADFSHWQPENSVDRISRRLVANSGLTAIPAPSSQGVASAILGVAAAQRPIGVMAGAKSRV